MNEVIYEKNIDALKARMGDIYLKIVSEEIEWNEEYAIVEQARNGEPVLCVNTQNGKKYINSRYNPSAEAEKYIENEVGLSEEACIVMVGISNTMYLKKFREKNKDSVCIIYEPSKNIFLRVIHDIDMTELLLDEKIWIAVEDINFYRFKVFLTNSIRVSNIVLNKHIVMPVYSQLFEKEISEAIKIIDEVYIELRSNMATAVKFGKEMCRNHILNMCFMPGASVATDLVGKFPKDLPAVIVAAGPSLEKNIDLLNEIKDKALIIAVDTALRVLTKHGIKPHFVVTVDGHKPVEYFDVDNVDEIVMISDAMMNNNVLNKVRPQRLFYYSAELQDWDELYKSEGTKIYYIAEGGTVAIEAMAIAILFEIKNLIIIGQDLAWTGKKMHADEEASDINEDDPNFLYVEGINEDKVITSRDYALYIKELELFAFKMSGKAHFVDATEGGAKKKNLEIMTLRDAINKYCINSYDIEGIINDAPRYFLGENKKIIKSRLLEMKKNLTDSKSYFEKARDAGKDGEKELLKKMPDKIKLKRINKTIAEADDIYGNLKERRLLFRLAPTEFYVFSIEVYKEDDDEIQDAIKLYKQSYEFYEGIVNVIPDIIEIIDETLDLWYELYGEDEYAE